MIGEGGKKEEKRNCGIIQKQRPTILFSFRKGESRSRRRNVETRLGVLKKKK